MSQPQETASQLIERTLREFEQERQAKHKRRMQRLYRMRSGQKQIMVMLFERREDFLAEAVCEWFSSQGMPPHNMIKRMRKLAHAMDLIATKAELERKT